jgi:molecular chaperone GrpE
MTDQETRIEEPQQPQEEQAKSCDEPLNALRQELESLQQERDDLFGRLQRVSADYANFQKRVPKQVNDSVVYEKDKILRSLLPILDNLDRVLKARSTDNEDALVRGVEIVYGHMLDILKSHGVEPIHAAGEAFDPSCHEAVMRRPEPDQPADIVLEEAQKGYRIGDRILRPTRVVISQASAPQPDAKASKEGQDVD